MQKYAQELTHKLTIMNNLIVNFVNILYSVKYVCILYTVKSKHIRYTVKLL